MGYVKFDVKLEMADDIMDYLQKALVDAKRLAKSPEDVQQIIGNINRYARKCGDDCWSLCLFGNEAGRLIQYLTWGYVVASVDKDTAIGTCDKLSDFHDRRDVLYNKISELYYECKGRYCMLNDHLHEIYDKYDIPESDRLTFAED